MFQTHNVQTLFFQKAIFSVALSCQGSPTPKWAEMTKKDCRSLGVNLARASLQSALRLVDRGYVQECCRYQLRSRFMASLAFSTLRPNLS